MKSIAKAQVSIEYLALIGIALLILGPVLVYATAVVGNSQNQLKISTARNAVDRIGDAADLVYVEGQPAQTSIQILLPDSTNSCGILNAGKTIQCVLSTASSTVNVFRDTNALLNSTAWNLPSAGGYYNVKIIAGVGGVIICYKTILNVPQCG